MKFLHSGCGGALVLELSTLYLIKAPSIAISTKGVIPDMVEISVRDREMRVESPNMFCTKCRKLFSVIEDVNLILGECCICKKSVPLEQLETSYEFPALCVSCREGLTSDNPTDDIKDIRKWLNLPTEFKFKSIFKLLLTDIQT